MRPVNFDLYLKVSAEGGTRSRGLALRKVRVLTSVRASQAAPLPGRPHIKSLIGIGASPPPYESFSWATQSSLRISCMY